MAITTSNEKSTYTEDQTKQNSGEELFTTDKEIDGSPFDLVIDREDDNKTFIKIGQFRVSEKMDYMDAYEKIKNKDWDLIMGAIGAVIRASEIVKELNTKEQ